MSNATCLHRGPSEMERPLIALKFQGKELHICPQCLPISIHKPSQLVDKLPGIRPDETPLGYDH